MTEFVDRAYCRPFFEGKRVAVVGSGPGVLENQWGYVDRHEVVVRVNNYKTSAAAGFRTDVAYSFWGSSCRKTREELMRDGVRLCMCKLPDADLADTVLDATWHRRTGKMAGVNYKAHYRRRRDAGFWFCPTYIPTVEEFMAGFRLLGDHMPTTGFAAILDVLSFNPAEVFLTGYDFFASGLHNVTDRWVAKNPGDPYRHRPDLEQAWVAQHLSEYPITVDAALGRVLGMKARAA